MNTVVVSSKCQEFWIIRELTTADSHHIVFVSVSLDNSSKSVNDQNFEIYFVLGHNNVSVFSELNFGRIESVQSNMIE